MKSRREERLSKPRRVSDPKYGFLGTIQKIEGGWIATNREGWTLVGPLGFATAKIAVSALYRNAGIEVIPAISSDLSKGQP